VRVQLQRYSRDSEFCSLSPGWHSPRAIRNLTLLILALSLANARPAFAANATDKNLRAAASLFARYETIFYTNTDLSTPLTIFKGLSRPAASSLSIPFGQLPSGLDLLNKHASSEILGNADAVLMGARNFVNPRAAGSAGYPAFFCFVVVYGKQPIPNFAKYFTQTPSPPAGAPPVWKWVADIYGIPPVFTFYATQVGTSYLVISNDDKDLQKVAADLASSTDPSKTLNTVRDWPLISQHEYWGYRFFRRKGLDRKDLAELDKDMPGVEAVELYVDIPRKAGMMRLLGSSTSKPAVATMNKSFAADPSGTPLAFKPQTPDTWNAPFSLAGGQTAMGKLWAILAYFGYEIII